MTLVYRSEKGSALTYQEMDDNFRGLANGEFTTAIASQIEAEAGTNNTHFMTALRTAQAIKILTGMQNITVFSSSGQFVVPDGVTSLYVAAAGGGGGGGEGYSSTYNGGWGGSGGLATSYLSVTPAQEISFVIGAGGAGSNSTNGSAGGTTTVEAITCTGGAGGTGANSTTPGTNGVDGVGTGGNLGPIGISTLLTILTIGQNMISDAYKIIPQVSKRPQGTSSTTAISYSIDGIPLPGAGGMYEGGPSGTNNASGGVGGAVIFIY
jgi:hypothetical protein